MNLLLCGAAEVKSASNRGWWGGTHARRFPRGMVIPRSSGELHITLGSCERVGYGGVGSCIVFGVNDTITL